LIPSSSRIARPARRLPAAVVLSLSALLISSVPTGHAAPSTRPLSFLVLGDWGRDGDQHQRDVAQQMGRVAAETDAAFVVSTGDNFYGKGVTSTSASQWETSFENIYSHASLQVPWYAVLGNHDHKGDPSAEVEYSKVSKRWRMPSRWFNQPFKLPGGGSAEFFFLDTQSFVEGGRHDRKHSDAGLQSKAAQLSWLESGLASSKADWKIVVGHHPVYSEGKHGDTPELIRDVKPLLERYGVQVYMNGHDHDMQHIVVNGVAYLTSGAGSKTRPTRSGPNTRFSLGNTSGFLAVALTRDRFDARFIDWTGRPVYVFTQARAAAPVPAETGAGP